MKRSHLIVLLALVPLLTTTAALAQQLPEDLEIVSSDPPQGHVDVLQDHDANRVPQGTTVISLEFNQPVVLTEAHVKVLTTGTNAPSIISVDGEDETWSILLDGPIPPGEATAISIGKGLAWVAFGSLPGDVNCDYVSDRNDVAALAAAVRAGSQNLELFDIDRNGQVEAADVARLQVLFSGSDGGTAWDGKQLDPTTLSITCCCSPPIGPFGFCTDTMASCPGGWTEVPCPCSASSCP